MFAVVLADSKDLVVIAPPIVHLIVALFIPILVGLITKITVPPAVKAVVLLILNALSAFIFTAMATDGSAVFTKEAFANLVLGVAISVAAYFGVYKPLDLTSSSPTGKLGTQLGIGPPAKGG